MPLRAMPLYLDTVSLCLSFLTAREVTLSSSVSQLFKSATRNPTSWRSSLLTMKNNQPRRSFLDIPHFTLQHLRHLTFTQARTLAVVSGIVSDSDRAREWWRTKFTEWLVNLKVIRDIEFRCDPDEGVENDHAILNAITTILSSHQQKGMQQLPQLERIKVDLPVDSTQRLQLVMLCLQRFGLALSETSQPRPDITITCSLTMAHFSPLPTGHESELAIAARQAGWRITRSSAGGKYCHIAKFEIRDERRNILSDDDGLRKVADDVGPEEIPPPDDSHPLPKFVSFSNGTLRTPRVAVPACNITWSNVSEHPVRTYWFDWAGDEILYHTNIQPGQSVLQQTYQGHLWIARQEDTMQLVPIDGLVYFSPERHATIRIGTKVVKKKEQEIEMHSTAEL